MAQKRKIQEAFGTPNGQLSAFAAARLAKQTKANPDSDTRPDDLPKLSEVAAVVAAAPFVERTFDSPASEQALDIDRIVVEATKRAPNATLSKLDHHTDAISQDDEEGLSISFRNDESITCVGEYDLSIIQGVATVYGTALHPNSTPLRVYAPSTHALPRITPLRDDTIVRLSHVQSLSLRKLEKFSPLFRNIWCTKTTENPHRSFKILRTAADDELQRALSMLEVDKSCQNVLTRLAFETDLTGMRVMAIGAKSSGKSTFNRLLCNRVLNKQSVSKVLFLDLDPGQPEFGPPGQISLVEVTAPISGPPFTHPAGRYSSRYRVVRSHTIAATTFKDDPAHYITCARDLVRYANARCPLVVNSCGWVTGLGANVLADLSALIGVTDLVVLDPVEEALVEYLSNSSTTLTCHRLPRQPPRPSPRTPAESRAMQTMSYFHHRATGGGQATKWSGRAISTTRPWIVSYDGPNAGLHSILSYNQSPNPEFLSEVLNGSLVALATISDHHPDEALNLARYTARPLMDTQFPDTQPARTAEEGLPYIMSDSQGLTYPLNPSHSECHGLALIRGIDVERKEVHLIISLPEAEVAGALMGKRVVLVRGAFDAPEWAYLEDLHSTGEDRVAGGDGTRPWVSKREPVGIEGAVWRLRHPPMAATVAAGRQ
ncbi:hypothetical protein LTR08_005706 [Meristemomyces frigidus]|nr:hypothetical protein LTR08_005706 [Meristemomyces frigidus]